jgi:hypothetical protein
VGGGARTDRHNVPLVPWYAWLVANERRPLHGRLARGAALLASCGLALGCNTILGADQDFVLGTTSTGTTTTTASGGGGVGGSTGGSGASGAGASGGFGASGGHGGTAGSCGTGGEGGSGGNPGWTVVETLTVPGDGSNVVSQMVLEGNVAYRLRASGTFNMNTNLDWMADAEYYNFAAPIDAVSGVDLGIGVDDATVDAVRAPHWGDYADSHVYEIDFPGTGAAITANYHDAVTYDNEGSLTLAILAWQ